MATDPKKMDTSETAGRIIRETTGDLEKPLPSDLESAWAEWSKGIQGVDQRGMTLLRAAFEAGYETGATNGAAVYGREGGLKGGKARAAKLSPNERTEIAKKAARARWGDD